MSYINVKKNFVIFSRFKASITNLLIDFPTLESFFS